MPHLSTTSNLTDLMNVGKSVAAYFERAGITRIDQLVGQDPVELYDTMCRIDNRRHDPCLLDTIMSAVDQANGNPARPWWTYTPHRKQLLEATAPIDHR
ncbi:helix-hairpin-helix domain-containing protein [Kribbella sp. NPDC023972]|uniref:helix-hairpin-helix domain-containing protein n=1 Tax=Kribbella sp. NPDC023972 TaxID=3154795 RepID=UPI0033EACF71